MTLRERCMLTFVNSITDKPDWNRKVFEEEILTKWKVEALEMDWKKAGVVHGDFSEKMFDYVSLLRATSSSNNSTDDST